MKDPKQKGEKSGVYRVECEECDSFYVGQTGRALATRFHEHKTKTTAVSSHYAVTGHDPQKLSISLLHPASKGRIMNALEEARDDENIQRKSTQQS